MRLRGVFHGSLGEIHRACHHADKRNGGFVSDKVAIIAPFDLFQPENTFYIQHVGIGAVHAGGFISAMKINKQVITRRGLRHPIVKIDRFLVITIHEIDFESLYAHIGIMAANFLHVLIHCGITGP